MRCTAHTGQGLRELLMTTLKSVTQAADKRT